MKEIEFNEIKKIDIEIMSDIDRVCRENNINYTIIGGTLIGAIRHKGFIPWDDDIDIAIKREDYERFVEVYKREKNDNYEIFNNKLNCNYYYQYSRVCDTRTIIAEKVMKPIENLGIFVDVFPIDYISSKNINSKLSRISFYVKAHAFKTSKEKQFKNNRLKEIIKKIIFNKDYQFYFNKIQKISQKENTSLKTDLAGVLVCGTGKKDLFPKHIFDTYVDLDFENIKVMAVKEYDVFLKHRFGDYMKLPPKEEQVTHHNMEVYWKE